MRSEDDNCHRSRSWTMILGCYEFKYVILFQFQPFFGIFAKIVWWSEETSFHHRSFYQSIQCTSSWAQLAWEEESRRPRCLKCQFRTSKTNHGIDIFIKYAWRSGSCPLPKWWIGVAESAGWDENEMWARFAKLVPCAICKKWLRT